MERIKTSGFAQYAEKNLELFVVEKQIMEAEYRKMILRHECL